MEAILLAAVGSGAITAIVTNLLTRRKNAAEIENLEADTAHKITEASAQMFDRMTIEIARLNAEISMLREVNVELTQQIATLNARIAAQDETIERLEHDR